jgi:hypothetical protein
MIAVQENGVSMADPSSKELYNIYVRFMRSEVETEIQRGNGTNLYKLKLEFPM